MARNITFQQITEELIMVFGNQERKNEYYGGSGARFSLFTGPFGSMSPTNRIPILRNSDSKRQKKRKPKP